MVIGSSNNNIVTLPTHCAAPACQAEWLTLPNLKAEAETLGQPEWRPMLRYVAQLHERSIHPNTPPVLPYPWEEIGTGYVGGRAFGHWDLIHQVLDTMDAEPNHARRQLMNYLHCQTENGYMPGTVYFAESPNSDLVNRYPCYFNKCGHPPVWPMAVEDYYTKTGDDGMLFRCIGAAEQQIHWFETHRKSSDGGYYYLDILEDRWESGVDEGVRFIDRPDIPMACVDATSHVYLLYDSVNRWRNRLGKPSAEMAEKAGAIRILLQGLFCEETGFFADAWSLPLGQKRPLSHEGMWPVVVGAATPEQARRVVRENLVNPERFFTPHPITTVAVSDTEHFALRCWRGPVWNSMTYWAARACLRYGFHEEACAILESALNASSRVFAETQTIWEFYHPFLGSPTELERKPSTPFNTPCRDYLGHNPLLVMARLWEECAAFLQKKESAAM